MSQASADLCQACSAVGWAGISTVMGPAVEALRRVASVLWAVEGLMEASHCPLLLHTASPEGYVVRTSVANPAS